jgi:putative flippase GtrA
MNNLLSPSKKSLATLLKFGMTGVCSTLIHIVVATTLISGFDKSTPIANGTAFILATLFSYGVNTLWSFSNQISSRNAIRFIIVSLVGLALTVLISLFADALNLHYMIGIAMVVITVPIYSFLAHSLWTYR